MWPLRVKMPTQNLLRLLLLLMLVTRIVLATVCGRFESWGLVKKLNFCSDFEHKVWSRFRSWSKGEIWSWSLVSFFCWCFVEVIWILVEILKQGLANIFKFNFSRDVWDFEVDTCSRFWSMKFDQDLCATCDMNSTLGSVVPLAMFHTWNMTRSGLACIIFCLFVTKVEELDVPEDPCNSSQDYNFYACVRAAVSNQV